VFAYLQDRYDQFVLEDIPEDLSRGSFFTRRNKFNTYTRRKPQKALAHVWHQRLGHPGPQALEHLVNCSKGVRIKGPTTVQCDVCGQAKIRQQTRRASRFLDKDRLIPRERLTIDFHNFITDDEKYRRVMLVLDRESGFCFDYYMKDESGETIISALNHLLSLFK